MEEAERKMAENQYSLFDGLEDTEENLRLFYETVRKNPEDTVEQLAERLMKKEEII